MTRLEYVDVATAKAAGGVRLVVSGMVPSPWSEAAKGLFKIQGVPALVVRAVRDDPAFTAWVQHPNVPVVLHDGDLPRTVWSEILMLAEWLGGEPGVLVPADAAARVRMVGTIHEIAGEDGLGWCARLVMIDAGLQSGGQRGFPLPVARYLAARYGHGPGRVEAARARARAVLGELARALGDDEYFGGARPNALDVYSATFLTPLSEIPEAACPRLGATLRAAFATAHEDLGDAVAPALASHRTRMLERHLGFPIEI